MSYGYKNQSDNDCAEACAAVNRSNARTYLVQRESYCGAIRWKLYNVDADGLRTTIGHYPTRKAAVTAGRLLAGWRGTVKVSTTTQMGA
jgi:hypothetical protein